MKIISKILALAKLILVEKRNRLKRHKNFLKANYYYKEL